MRGRVFVLGAGASRQDSLGSDPPLPLADEFFTPRYLKAIWSRHEFGGGFLASPLGRVLTRYFSYSRKNARINIEEVYSFLEATRHVFSGQFAERGRIFTARNQLLQYVQQLIIELSLQTPSKLQLHRAIAKNLTSSDSVISFNWDPLLDAALATTKAGRALLRRQSAMLSPLSTATTLTKSAAERFQDRHRGQLLKVHRAINLTACSSPTCVRRGSVARFDGRAYEEGTFWPCEACGGPTEVLMIPPHFQKTYASDRFIRLQASLALLNLSMAAEIVIIGYSFPLYDLEARSLFRSCRLEWWHPQFDVDDPGSWLERVVVVNPEVSLEAYRQKVEELFGISDAVNLYGHSVSILYHRCVEEFMAEESRRLRRRQRRKGVT
jgi:hypothetical protein